MNLPFSQLTLMFFCKVSIGYFFLCKYFRMVNTMLEDLDGVGGSLYLMIANFPTYEK